MTTTYSYILEDDATLFLRKMLDKTLLDEMYALKNPRIIIVFKIPSLLATLLHESTSVKNDVRNPISYYYLHKYWNLVKIISDSELLLAQI